MTIDADEVVTTPVSTWRVVSLEKEILAVLETPREPHETLELAFRRKERELRDLFARLVVGDARELHRRLCVSAADDAIALRFGRLIVERRGRLLAFLADARRREVLHSAAPVAAGRAYPVRVIGGTDGG